jgi:hypothetical protein
VRVRFPRIAFLFAYAVSLALPLAAQSTNGTINGRVLDPSNKVIGGADILAINDATGVQYSGKTNGDGIYIVPNLPPGPYRLQVSKVGFKTLIKPDIVLNIQDALSINFTLPVGAVFEIVTVEGGASMINTTDASVSTVVDQSYVKNMPLNGRSFQDLILLTPGIATQSPQPTNFVGGLGANGEFSVNGQRPESNYYTVDGVSANVGAVAGGNMVLTAGASGSVAASTALGTTQALVSVEDLQEFRVQSSTYSAEYGRNPGGQFAFETKSGTNQWHGTAYDYLRNGSLDSNDWFNNYFGVRQPALRQNDFGGTLGGPVEIPHLYSGKDKTFFFVSYEGLRLIAPQPATISYVPDAALRASAPSPLSQVLNAFPKQSPDGIDDTANGIAQFIGAAANPGSIDSVSVRLDHVIRDKHRLFFRFSDTQSSSATRGGSDGRSLSNSSTSDYTLRTYTLGASSVFSNHLANDCRVNYSTNNATLRRVIDSFGGGAPVSLAQLVGLNNASLDVALLYGGYFTYFLEEQPASAQKQWNLVDTVSLSLRRHHFKFGADHRRLAPFSVTASPTVAYFYMSESGVQNNNAFTFVQNTAPAHPLYENFSAFAQDEWRASQSLSLSLGLRWEVNPAPGVTQGLKPYALLEGSNPNTWALAPEGTPLWRTTWHNLAPRFGIAYILRSAPRTETVVRGGAGVFFDTGQQMGSVGFYGPGFVAFSDFLPGSFPVLPAIPAIVNPPVPPYGTVVRVIDPNLQLPYTVQWNGSIEQGLGKSQALTVSYVGAHADRLMKGSSLSPPGNLNSPQGFEFIENGLTSDYDALQAQYRRRMNRGLTALASYTWSHCLDYGSQDFLLGYQRGNCDFDIRHNVSAALSYDLRNVGKRRLLRALVDQWGIDDRFTARTAFPVTLAGSQLVDPSGQLYNAGLDLVSDQPIYLYGRNCESVLQGLGDLTAGQTCPGGRAINPQAFSAVSSGLGNAPRNFTRAFGAVQMDLAVRRDFPIHERLKVQLRAEAFNVFNHPNFGTVNSSFGQNTFGQATAMLATSLGVLSPQYQMGGPRSMQFALKLLF